MRRVVKLLVAIGLLFVIGTAARADQTADWKLCSNEDTEDDDGVIRACTSVIKNPSLSSADRSKAYAFRGISYAINDNLGTGSYDCSRPESKEPKSAAFNRCAAIPDCVTALELDPANAVAHRCRGLIFYSAEKYDDAIVSFNEAIRLKPDYARAFSNRGNAYLGKRQYDQAIQNYDQAIRLKPDYAVAFNNRGRVYIEKGQFDRAIQDYDQAIRLKPDYAVAFRNRGFAYYYKDQPDRAIKDFDQAIRLKPDFHDAFLGRGLSYKQMGKYDSAIKDLDQAIRLEPDNAIAYFVRGEAYSKLQQYDRAIADLEKALQLAPEQADIVLSALAEARAGKAALANRANAANSGARVALVIGNSVYEHDALLPNSRRDAKRVAEQLKALGFTLFGNPDKDYKKAEMESEIDAFRKAAVGADAAVVWYTGHGQKMREEGAEFADDWVIPVDALIKKRADISKAAIRVDRLKNSVLAAKTLRLVVIDACRDSKFYTGGMGSSGYGDRTGLKGAMVVYSTQPGNTADAGPDDGSSPFVQAFLELLPKLSKTDIRKFFSAVTGRTLELNPDQRPEVINGLADEQTVTLAK